MQARVILENGMSPTSGCLQDKIVVLSDANAVLDAAAHEAKAAQSRTQQEKVSKASPSRRSSSTLAQQHSSADHAQKACFSDKEWRKAVLGVAHGAAGQNRSEHGGAQEPQHMAGGGAVHKDRGCPAGAPLCGLPGTLALPMPSSNLSK